MGCTWSTAPPACLLPVCFCAVSQSADTLCGWSTFRLQDERVDGMFVRRTVRELLWGYEDPTLVGECGCGASLHLWGMGHGRQHGMHV